MSRNQTLKSSLSNFPLTWCWKMGLLKGVSHFSVAAKVQYLRKATGAGMAECAKAIRESNGDLENAHKFLQRTSLNEIKNIGELNAAIVGSFIAPKLALLTDMRTNTDFGSNSELFRTLVETVTTTIAVNSSSLTHIPENMERKIMKLPVKTEPKNFPLPNELQACLSATKNTIFDLLEGGSALLGEPVKLSKVLLVQTSNLHRFIGSYLHQPLKNVYSQNTSVRTGLKGALVCLQVKVNEGLLDSLQSKKVQSLSNLLAMQNIVSQINFQKKDDYPKPSFQYYGDGYSSSSTCENAAVNQFLETECFIWPKIENLLSNSQKTQSTTLPTVAEALSIWSEKTGHQTLVSFAGTLAS